MKNKIQIFLTFLLLAVVSWLAGIGANKTLNDHFGTKSSIETFIKAESNGVCETTTPKSTASEAGFISGPLAANLGDLCVFNLNDPKSRADWAVVRQSNNETPINAYIDSSGSSVVFASNIDSKYTVVAAVVEEGNPKILKHVCEYGMIPLPNPEPKPDPTPKPNPEPSTLSDWIKQNVPESGKTQSNILASVYEAASLGIEKGTIKTPEAAFSSIRTNTQTKISLNIWKDFLDKLSEKINERFTGNRDIKELGAIFKEIAGALKTNETPKPQVVLPNEKKPVVNQAYCNDPTGRACQIQQPRYIYGGRR